jgi:hypothetical protein
VSKFTRTLEVWADTVRAGDTVLLWDAKRPGGRPYLVRRTGATEYGDVLIWVEGRTLPHVAPCDVTMAVLSA